MPKQTINLGTTANDNTGDGARTAGAKINDNFTELYSALAKLASSSIGHCSVDGSDTTGDGTPGNPWRQPSKAVTEGKRIIVLGPGSFSSGITISYNAADEYAFLGVPGRTILSGSNLSLLPSTPDNLTIRLSGVQINATMVLTPYSTDRQVLVLIGTQTKISGVRIIGLPGSDEGPSGRGGGLSLEGSTLMVNNVELDPGTDMGGGEGEGGICWVKHAEVGAFVYSLYPPEVIPYHAIIGGQAVLDTYP